MNLREESKESIALVAAGEEAGGQTEVTLRGCRIGVKLGKSQPKRVRNSYFK